MTDPSAPVPPPLPPRKLAPPRSSRPREDAPRPRRERASPRKKSLGMKILLFGVLLPIGILLGFIACAVLFYALSKELPVEAEDRAVLVTAEVLAEWCEGLDPSLGTETVQKHKLIDGTYELEYEFDLEPADPEDEDAWSVWTYCMVSIDTSAGDASLTWSAGSWGSDFGLSLGDIEMKERPDLYRYGSKSRCALLTLEDGTLVGNYFTCLVGARTFEWMVTGVFFDEPGQLEELLGPILDRLLVYTP